MEDVDTEPWGLHGDTSPHVKAQVLTVCTHFSMYAHGGAHERTKCEG